MVASAVSRRGERYGDTGAGALIGVGDGEGGVRGTSVAT
jgi:hypothetical protein